MKFYLAADVFCPKCGVRIVNPWHDKQTGKRYIFCENESCELHKIKFEAPTIELEQLTHKK